MDITFNLIETTLASRLVEGEGFLEFCRCLKDIDALTDDTNYFLEAVEQRDIGVKRQVNKILGNTASTTKDVGKIMGMATDAGGAGIKSIWDLFMKLANLAVKAAMYIVKKIVLIPETIGKLIDVISSIPGDIKRRIRGDITLYITINDIQYMMDNYLLQHMLNFIAIANQLSKGDMWTSLLRKESDRPQPDYNRASVYSDSDMKLIKKLRKEYGYFSSAKFSKTTINMSDADVVEDYFGTGMIKYKDIHGVEHNATYYNSLKELVKLITERKAELATLSTDIGDKINRTQLNQNFITMSPHQQKEIVSCMTMISKTIQILGEIVKYMIIDMNTIQKTTTQILDRQNKIASGAGKKHIGRSDSAITDLEVNEDPNDDINYVKNMKQQGYIRVERFIKDKTGAVTKEISGIVDENNKDAVWIKKDNMPKGAKRI